MQFVHVNRDIRRHWYIAATGRGIKGLAFEDGRKLARRLLTSTRRKKSTEAGKDLTEGKRNHHQRRRETTSTTAVVYNW